MKLINILLLFPVVQGRVAIHGAVDSTAGVRRTSSKLLSNYDLEDDATTISFDSLPEELNECQKNGFYKSEFGGGSEFGENSDDIFNSLRYGFNMDGEGVQISEIKAKIDDFATQHCKTAESNPKLKYTSKDVCTFKFHSITGQEKIPDGYLSSACNDKNVVESVKSYMIDDPPQEKIARWPDACVGDFLRCYDVKRDRPILLRHICMTETFLKKDFPAGTTHVSVDCRDDKQKQIKYLQETFVKVSSNNYAETYAKADRKRRRALYTLIFSIIGVIGLGCSTCMVVIHRYAWKPYLQALKTTKVGVDDSMNGDSELVPIRTRLTAESRQPLI
jgi:hypothetical protein